MPNHNSLTCPVCKADSFCLKHEATYVYSYLVDSASNAPGRQNELEFLPFLYDNREQKDTKQYLECQKCGAHYPCYFDHWDEKVGLAALREAINASEIKQE